MSLLCSCETKIFSWVARVPLPKPYDGAERRRDAVCSPKVDLVPPKAEDIVRACAGVHDRRRARPDRTERYLRCAFPRAASTDTNAETRTKSGRSGLDL